ncbi:MAG: hypothetical protein AAF483_05300 [Planctomycetota bacterium]
MRMVFLWETTEMKASILTSLILLLALIAQASGQGTGTVVIDFLEKEAEEPLVCRVQIQDARGRSVRGRGTLFQNGWNLVENTLTFRGRPGDYRYRAYHGPQLASANGEFKLDKNSEGYDVVRMPRHANLLEESWYAGDLAARLAPAQIQKWMQAEDLQMSAVLQTKVPPGEKSERIVEPENVGEPWVEDASYLDDRAGSGLALHHWLPPAEVPQDLPSTKLLVIAKNNTAPFDLPVHAEITKLWARDVPIWLASNRIDSIQVLSTHLTLTGEGGAKFKPFIDPDPGRFRGALGPGRMIENIYWKVLDAGLRIPPSAGSGFGKIDSVLGYNRVYVACAEGTAENWWRGLKAGNCFVTSGPLLRAKVNGEVPGAVFQAEKELELDVALTLTTSDPVSYLDVIFNGRTLYEARLNEFAREGGKIPPLKVKESGWLVVRVVTDRNFTYRIATTAPFYCEVGGEPRVSKAAVEFFETWLAKAAEQIGNSSQAQASASFINAARKFWLDRKAIANVP